MTLYETFQENVRALMAYHGVNQSDLARRMGVTPAFVSHLLVGRRRPGLDTIESVARALGVEPHRLLEKVPVNIAQSA